MSLHSPNSQIAKYFFLIYVEMKQRSETPALLQVLFVRQRTGKAEKKDVSFLPQMAL